METAIKNALAIALSENGIDENVESIGIILSKKNFERAFDFTDPENEMRHIENGSEEFFRHLASYLDLRTSPGIHFTVNDIEYGYYETDGGNPFVASTSLMIELS